MRAASGRRRHTDDENGDPRGGSGGPATNGRSGGRAGVRGNVGMRSVSPSPRGGVSRFCVRIDGELVYSKDQTGRHAEDGEVLEIVREILDPDVSV